MNDCFALLRAWQQAEVTWNEASSGVLWATPGANGGTDSGSDVLCTVNASSTGDLSVNLNAEGLAIVQSWISNPSSNHGILVTDPNTSDGADFHASESADAMARPKLQITYRIPGGGVNSDPVAGFSNVCTSLDCDFMDQSTDSDGSISIWSWDTIQSSVSINHCLTSLYYGQTIILTIGADHESHKHK